MSEAKFEAVKELIREKKYSEARAVLKTMDDPKAQQWLQKLDARASKPKRKNTKRIVLNRKAFQKWLDQERVVGWWVGGGIIVLTALILLQNALDSTLDATTRYPALAVIAFFIIVGVFYIWTSQNRNWMTKNLVRNKPYTYLIQMGMFIFLGTLQLLFNDIFGEIGVIFLIIAGLSFWRYEQAKKVFS